MILHRDTPAMGEPSTDQLVAELGGSPVVDESLDTSGKPSDAEEGAGELPPGERAGEKLLP
eukprot:COSAG02_NODE_768_length_17375_cov_52.865015_3_plen_61_part_00